MVGPCTFAREGHYWVRSSKEARARPLGGTEFHILHRVDATLYEHLQTTHRHAFKIYHHSDNSDRNFSLKTHDVLPTEWFDVERSLVLTHGIVPFEGSYKARIRRR